MSRATVGMLTYAGHLDKEDLRNFLYSLWPKQDMKVAIAWETGESEYEHTHAVIHFGKSTHISTNRVARGFDFEGIHPNWKRGKGNTAWKDMLKYISKEDEDIGFEIEKDYSDIINTIWECETNQEVLQLCRESSDVIPFLTLFRNRINNQRHIDYANQFLDAPLRPEQQEWWDLLQVQNDRQILWICDYDGGLGKTWFAKWLFVNHNAEILTLNTKAINFMYNGARIAFIDLTRSQEEYVSYTALEILKNGLICSDKYEGRRKLFEPPKVIVFANYMPNTIEMTGDRWVIKEYGELKI